MNEYHSLFLYDLSLLFATIIFYRCETNWFAPEYCMNSDFMKPFQAAKQDNRTRKYPCNNLPHWGPSLALRAWLCCGTWHIGHAPVSKRTRQRGTQTEVAPALPQTSCFYNTQLQKYSSVLFYCWNYLSLQSQYLYSPFFPLKGRTVSYWWTYQWNCQTWSNEVQSRFLINKIPLERRKGTWVI